VVTGTGLVPHTQYTCVLLGTIGSGASGQASPLPMPTSILVSGIPGASGVSVDSVVDDLGLTNVTFSSTRQTTTGGSPLLGNYTTLKVRVVGLSAAANIALTAFAGAAQMGVPQSRRCPGGAGAYTDFYLPIVARVSPGDAVSVGYQALDGTTPTASLDIWGLGQPYQPYPLRADGRLRVSGSQAQSAVQAASGSTNLIGAPGASLSILLKSAHIAGTGGGVGGQYGAISATVDGVGAALVVTGTGGFASDGDDFGDGLLCDVNTAVVLAVSGGGGVVGGVSYDVVL
jgi:hypothetical protein